MIHLDTHVAVWLYSRHYSRIPSEARTRLDSAELQISPMATLELAYLHEVGKVLDDADTVMRDLARRFDLSVATTPFPPVCDAARALTWTRDPFDRVIAAQASVDAATLLTADRTILDHVANAWWP